MRRFPLLATVVSLFHSSAAWAAYPHDANPPYAAEGRSGGVLVAVIDSGVDYLHPELKNSIWKNPGEVLNGLDDDGNGYVDDLHGWDFAGNDAHPFDVLPEPPRRQSCAADDIRCRIFSRVGYIGRVLIGLLRPGAAGHGTHVAGIVKEVSGGTATILPLRIDYHASTEEWARQVVRAVEYASRAGAKVMNMSFGVYPGKLEAPALAEVKKMIKEIASAAGSLVVIAAGNEKKDMVASREVIAPGGINAPHVLTVGAVTEQGELAEFSNIGEGIVDVYAPGVDVMSTWPGGGTQAASGTSMATPFVAGLAAKLMAAGPRASVAEIATRIREIATDTFTGFDDEAGQLTHLIRIPVILRDTARGF